ncbi:unnamed protein product [Alternaria alternata]
MSAPSLAVPLTENCFVRRLPSTEATRENIQMDPTVVVPPQHLMAPSKQPDIASDFETARRHFDAVATGSPDYTPPESSVTDKCAFAFDIDGVLIRGGRPIPEAIEAMKMLNGENEYGIQVPYIFVTNGGGKTEAERCVQLSKQLELEVSPQQFICGHTPMSEMAQKYCTVLVVGGEGEKCRIVAEGYGFKDVSLLPGCDYIAKTNMELSITPGDIIKDNQDTTPFRKLTEEEYNNSRARNFAEIILDLLMSKNGRLGTRSANYDEGPPVFFSHDDVVWSASYDLTRIGMGALRVSLEAMFKAVTGRNLETTVFGKPQIATFQFATRLLQKWRKDTHGIDSAPSTVYFVGDTPESDIRGTNEYDEQTSDATGTPSSLRLDGTKPRFEPKATVNTVLDAVKHGMEREYKKALKESMMATA